MKYIRTKDENIYDIDRKYNNCVLSIEEKRSGPHSREVKLIFTNKSGGWSGKRIDSQSDNLEDLFDAYMVIKGKHHVCYMKRNWVTSHKLLLADIKEGIKIVYGCILTDTGLNYVAKMNAEGEFNLL